MIQISHAKIIFISFATIKKPGHADVFVKARGKPLQRLRSEIVSHYSAPTAQGTAPQSWSPSSPFPQHFLQGTRKQLTQSPETLLLIDTLHPLATTAPRHLTAFLSSLLTHPAVSLVATYHADVPLPLPPAVLSEYEPHPLTMLNHLATAVLRMASLPQAVERRRAQNRSLPAPEFGLDEGREGVLVGVKSPTRGDGGFVVEMELRRRSGRAVVEKFVLVPSSSSSKLGVSAAASATDALSLLSDHPLFAVPEDGDGGHAGGGDDDELAETTFNLGLTEKQRKDREGIVLPYFDAQEDIGGSEGGRILYEMGREDDFDDEEDEI